MILGARKLRDQKRRGKATIDIISFKIKRRMQGNPINPIRIDNSNPTWLLPVLNSLSVAQITLFVKS